MTWTTAAAETSQPTSWVTVHRWPSRAAEPPDTWPDLVTSLPAHLHAAFLAAVADHVEHALTEGQQP